MTAIDRPATIITPRLPFQVNSKISILQGGSAERAHLTSRVTATGSFSQFEYHLIEQPKEEKNQSETDGASLTVSTEDDFDSLWKSL